MPRQKQSKKYAAERALKMNAVIQARKASAAEDKGRARIEKEKKCQILFDTFKLSEDQTEQLVQLYKDQEDLWKGEDPPHDDHSAVAEDIRRKGWAYIASTMAIPNLGPAEVEMLIEMYTKNFKGTLKLPPEVTAFSYWHKKMNFLLTAKPLPDPEEKKAKKKDRNEVVEEGEDGGGANSDVSEEYIVEIKEEANSDDEDVAHDFDDLANTEEHIEHITVDQIEQDQAVSSLSQYLIPAARQPSTSKAVDDTVVTSLFVHTPRELNGKKKKTNSGTAVPCESIFVEVAPKQPKTKGRVLRERKPKTTSDTSVVEQLKTVIRNQNKMIKLLQAQKTKEDDRFDKFGRFVASSLRQMGTYESLALQPKIVELMSTHEAKRPAIAQHVPITFMKS